MTTSVHHMDKLEALFTAIREDCPAQTWSCGIQLARANAVTGRQLGDDDIELRIRPAGGAIASTVTLHLLHEEWECSCNNPADTCEHVAGAIIAMRQARTAGSELPVSRTTGSTLTYRLGREGHRIRLDRSVLGPDGEVVPLTVSLEELVNGSAKGSSVVPEPIDLRIDQFLQVRRLASLPGDVLTTLLPLLSEVTELYLEDERIVASNKPVLPRVLLDDSDHGFVLRVEAAPEVTEVLTSGVALCLGKPPLLCPLGETTLTGKKLELLPNVRTFALQHVAELVCEVLPALERRIPVEVRSSKLPPLQRNVRPRVILEVSQQDDRLSVVPSMVYGDPPTARVDDNRLVHLGGPLPIRDRGAEAQQAALLREALDMIVGRQVDAIGPDAMTLARSLHTYQGTIHGDAHRRLYPERALTPRVAIDGVRMELAFDLDNGETPPTQAAPSAVLRAWENGDKLAPLLGGGWAALPEEWLTRLGPQVCDLFAARKADGTVPPAARPALAQLCDDLDQPRPPELARLAPLLDGFEAIPAVTTPADLCVPLRDYQQEGIDWLSFLKTAGLGAILADDMGLGKTLQALCVMTGRCLVVCPTSVMHNWADEIRRFRPRLTFEMYHGSKRALNSTCDITITSYALLRLDVDCLCGVNWKVLVLDETQAIKNPNSQTAQAAFRLPAAFRIALSGTPVENRLDELWSQAHFANPGVLGGLAQFQQRYADPITSGDQDAARRLRQRIRPFVLRRRKLEVAPELPPRTESILYCVLDESERALYDSILLSTRRQVAEQLAAGGGILGAFEALLRLRQVACHRALIEQKGAPPPQLPMSSKIRRLMFVLEQTVASGHKALVFSQWTSFLDLVEPHLNRNSVPFERLDGTTRDRAAVVSRFQDATGPPLMLLSLKAGGVGLNLTAADHVFLLDPWWNPAVEAQAADRAHRIGQDKPVMIYRMVSRDTVEERILELQQRKQELAAAVLSDGTAARGITRDDLLALLQ